MKIEKTMWSYIVGRFFSKEIIIKETALVLRPPHKSDFSQWLELRRQSQHFLQKWEPKWPEDDLSKAGFQRRLDYYAKGFKSGEARSYFLHDTEKNLLLGGLSLTRIDQRHKKSALLGYWMGEAYAGKGYMQKAVPTIIKFAFQELKLKSVDAAVIPRNQRSIHLLEKCGFIKIGFENNYLEINGMMEDHLLYLFSPELFDE